ncbi:MAG: biopolymer transporter ExbD [Lentisphaerae bacterium]|nr:biopolymer transporter ExbD [Lentisphaerota bacterium]
MLAAKSHAETVSGLRTRYRPRSRLGQGLISMAPWLDFVLLMIFFVLIKGNFIIEPGVRIELPRAQIRDGAPQGLAAVVLSVESGTPGVRDEIVVFNDLSFRLGDRAQVLRLKLALQDEAHRRGVTSLLLEADRHVQHGTLVEIYGLARDIGLTEVNLAARPGEAAGRGLQPSRTP